MNQKLFESVITLHETFIGQFSYPIPFVINSTVKLFLLIIETLNTAVDKPIIKEFTSDNVTQKLEAQVRLTQKKGIQYGLHIREYVDLYDMPRTIRIKTKI